MTIYLIKFIIKLLQKQYSTTTK